MDRSRDGPSLDKAITSLSGGNSIITRKLELDTSKVHCQIHTHTFGKLGFFQTVRKVCDHNYLSLYNLVMYGLYVSKTFTL